MTILNTATFTHPTRGKLSRQAANLLPSLTSAAYLVYAIFGLADEGVVQPDYPPAAVASEPQPAVETANYQLIADWHLFGLTPSGDDDQTVVVPSRSGLKLLGTFVAWPNLRSAVIQAADGSQKKYRIGEQLSDGSVLREILPDRVLISQNGRRESLALAKLSANPAPAE